MRLTIQEKEILDGKHGEAARIALSILTELGALYDAEEMLEVSQVHCDSGFYTGDAGLEFAEDLAELGAAVAVPASLNASTIDLERGREYRVSAEFLEKNRKLERALLKMGFIPTWTCAPYQGGLIPRFGEHIAWTESNAIAFANSVIGARTNRHGDLIDICAAIVGKVPKFGLHLPENRKAEILIRFEGITKEMFDDEAIYPLLGYLIGEMAGDRVVAVEGMPKRVEFDCLKGFGAAAASSGAVALFHIIGVTPEAHSLKVCFHGTKPKAMAKISPKMIQDAEQKIWTAKGEVVDLVALGCPHFSMMEFRELTRLMEGKKVHGSVFVLVFTSRAVYAWAEKTGMLKKLNDAGVTVFTDGCALMFPQEEWHFRAIMTNSVKLANYCYSQTRLDVAYGNLRDCVYTATLGRICRRRSPWEKP